jgi:hypothetical protein
LEAIRFQMQHYLFSEMRAFCGLIDRPFRIVFLRVGHEGRTNGSGDNIDWISHLAVERHTILSFPPWLR